MDLKTKTFYMTDNQCEFENGINQGLFDWLSLQRWNLINPTNIIYTNKCHLCKQYTNIKLSQVCLIDILTFDN